MIHMDLSDERLAAHVQNIWDFVWKMFYHPGTQLIYDYLTSYEPGRQFETLPAPEEIQRQDPNPCGWGSGMEDSVINGGAMLSAICDRFAVTGEAEMREAAEKLFKGLYDCTMSHDVPGFVARSICPADGKSVYDNSSRDQYTHLVHGFWKYYHSPLADEAAKAKIREALLSVARFTERSVTPENNYNLLMYSGKPAPLVCQMWNLDEIGPHEAARLPMIYAAAWDVSGDRHFLDECNKYLHDSLDVSCQLWPWPYLAYALFQMACSLELLLGVFPDMEDRPLLVKAFQDAAERSQHNAMVSAGEFLRKEDDIDTLYTDWRKSDRYDNYGYFIPRTITRKQTVREAGEAALIQMMAPDFHFTDLQRTLLKRAIAYHDYKQFSDYSPIPLLAAYWRMKLLEK